jgi:Fe-S oxidoreductase
VSLPIGPTVGILADNLRLRGSVLPVPEAGATRWSRGLDLPRGGQTVLYTGGMYQLIPYIAAMGRAQERLADSPLARYAGLGRAANRVVNISAFMARPGEAARAEYDRSLRNISRLLRLAGVGFGYLYGEELYSGALIHDLGMDDALATHAQRVYEVLRKHGVRRLITVDPHTTHMLRSVYPKVVGGYDLEVESYLEVVARAGLEPRRGLEREVAIHDSCIYARYMNVTGEPRGLLSAAGVTVKEPEFSGRLTWCCGGPIESLYPKKALEGAEKRVEQLKEAAGRAVTMCPICLVNLRRAGGDGFPVTDISDYLIEAYDA